MDATQARTVAEVMGWQVIPGHDNGDGSRTMTTYTRPDAEVVWCGDPRPDVDDMLTWIDANTHQDQQVSMYMRNRGPAEWCVLITNPRSIFAEFRAPTLHAALEQAVLAVGGAE